MPWIDAALQLDSLSLFWIHSAKTIELFAIESGMRKKSPYRELCYNLQCLFCAGRQRQESMRLFSLSLFYGRGLFALQWREVVLFFSSSVLTLAMFVCCSTGSFLVSSDHNKDIVSKGCHAAAVPVVTAVSCVADLAVTIRDFASYHFCVSCSCKVLIITGLRKGLIKASLNKCRNPETRLKFLAYIILEKHFTSLQKLFDVFSANPVMMLLWNTINSSNMISTSPGNKNLVP